MVMPAYNEAAFIEEAVRTVVAGLTTWGRPFEVCVVENGSTDGTRTIALRLADEIPELSVVWLTAPNYGEAIRTGLLEAAAPIAVMFDVDCLDLDFLKEALTVLDDTEEPTGPVIVVGSKRAHGARDERPWHRRLATEVFTCILRATFGLAVTDTHGMKVIRRDVLDPLIRRCVFGTDLFDTELIIRAERAGWRDTEVPVTVAEHRPARTSILHRVPRTLGGIVKLRIMFGRRPPT